jgi:hypothetical protein
MPKGTARSVRLRELAFAGGVAVAIVLMILATLTVFRTLPHGDRNNPHVAGDGYASPLEDVPPGWPAVEVSDPAFAYIPNLASDPDVLDGPVVLASGSVDGSAFTFYAFTARRGNRTTECLGFAGFATPGESAGTAPDVQTCAYDPAVPENGDLALVGAGSAERPDLQANFGFVSRRVERIYVWGGEGLGMFEIPVLDGLEGWNASPYLFVPSVDAGPIEVEGGQTSQPLARADVCHGSEISGSCRTDVQQLVPVGTDVDGRSLEPGAWPEVTTGGEFTPYVDHVMSADGVLDAGVVGEKVVIAYGTVQGIPWSLAAFNVRDGGGWTGNGGPDGEPGPAGELFLGAGGTFGGGGLALYATTPWQPDDLGVSGFGFGAAGVSGYAGVMSTRVDRVEVHLTEGEVRTVPLVDGPAGVDARYFIVWTPNEATGRIVAYDSEGAEIDDQVMCVTLPDPDSTSSCA